MQIYTKCIQLSLENLFNMKYKTEHINIRNLIIIKL